MRIILIESSQKYRKYFSNIKSGGNDLVCYYDLLPRDGNVNEGYPEILNFGHRIPGCVKYVLPWFMVMCPSGSPVAYDNKGTQTFMHNGQSMAVKMGSFLITNPGPVALNVS